jgi:hypothetical protein
MKQFVLALVAMFVGVSALAQSDYIVRTCKIGGKDGSMTFVEPRSTLVIDITI